VFFPSAEFLQTTRITTVSGEQFRTDGRVMQSPGWLAVYGKSLQDETVTLPAIAQGEKVATIEAKATANQTRPPARFNEATLLSAMEGAGKLVEDDELREAMAAKGLGTPATRAAVIEGLIYEKYIERLGRELKPTWKAFRLFFALRHFGVDEITSPELTGDWEFKLKQMEQAKLPREKFMEHIEQVARDLVKRIKSGTIPEEAFASVAAPCPKCGGVIQETYRKFQCQSCDFYIWPVLLGRDWSPEEVAELVTKKFIGPLNGFRSKQGRPFSAGLKLNDDFKIEFDFGQGTGDSDEPVDFSGKEALGACPKCGSRVFEHGVSYVCEKSVGPKRSCDFRSGRMILQQPVEPAQMQKLLATGRTDLLTNFMSKKNRKFKAFLVKTPQGKIGFEFLPRAEKPAKTPVVEKPLKKAAAEKPASKAASKKKMPAKKKNPS
jgi:DNA topoisomerase-3